jgi:hypothetical protein
MTMVQDRELRDWIDAWQATNVATTLPLETIGARVRSRVRLLRIWAASEAVVAVAALAFVNYRAIVDSDPFEKIAMGLLGVIALSGLAGSWWNWRGVWRASTEPTSAFLALSIVRTRRFQRYLQAGWLILIAEISVFVPWIRHRLYAGPNPVDSATEWFAWAFLVTMGVSALIFLLAAHRWVRRERDHLRAIEQEMAID